MILGLLRTKIAAVLLGPAGVGLIGLYQSLISAAVPIASLGITDTGSRQVSQAQARHDRVAVDTARLALIGSSIVLALLGAMAFWTSRLQIAELIFGDSSRGREVGWLGIGVAFSILAAAQTALLSGLGRISSIAKASAYSAFAGTLVSASALFVLGPDGVVAFVLAAPIVSFVVSHFFVRHIPFNAHVTLSRGGVGAELSTLARLGFVVMWSGVALNGGFLIIRTVVQDQLGLDALGVFQSAWMISMIYVGLVLGAMGTDYYPRISAAFQNRRQINRLINRQTEVALLLTGPVFLLVLLFAPWILKVLYSSAFVEGANVLRWQVLGDILKVASWPLGFAILASGDGKRFFLAQAAVISAYVFIVIVGLPHAGLEITGIGFFAMYGIALAVNYCIVHQMTGLRWSPALRLQLVTLLLLAGSIMCLIFLSERAALLAGVPIIAVVAAVSGLRLARIVAPHSLYSRFPNAGRLPFVQRRHRRS